MAKKFYLNNPVELNKKFYKHYDEAFIMRKAEVIVSIVDKIDDFKDFLIEDNRKDFFEKEKYIETLNAELHFSEFQQFEAFFAILIAIYQNLPHWLYLTTYRTSEIKEKVEAFLKNEITIVSNGVANSPCDLVNEAIYGNFQSDDPEIKMNWEINIENIIWFIKRIAKKYMEGTEYNAYKHGLRTFIGPTFFRLFPKGEPQKGINFKSDDSINFLNWMNCKEMYFK